MAFLRGQCCPGDPLWAVRGRPRAGCCPARTQALPSPGEKAGASSCNKYSEPCIHPCFPAPWRVRPVFLWLFPGSGERGPGRAKASAAPASPISGQMDAGDTGSHGPLLSHMGAFPETWLQAASGLTDRLVFCYRLSCVPPEVIRPQNGTAFGDSIFVVKMRSLGWALNPSDWCPFKKRR